MPTLTAQTGTIILILFMMLSLSSLTIAQDYTKISEAFFAAVKNDDRDAAEKTANVLAQLPANKLKDHLNKENKAKAFWINIQLVSAVFFQISWF